MPPVTWPLQAITSGPLSAIGDTLTPLLAALRMVWVISRHYSDDERMSGLLQRVAFSIAERSKESVDLKVRAEGREADQQLSWPLRPLRVLQLHGSRVLLRP